VFERYDDTNYGYLRVVVDPGQLRIEYHPASDGIHAKTPDDSVTIDLRSRKRTTYNPNDLGFPERAASIRGLLASQASRPGQSRGNRRPVRRSR
jgi:hypothetical protein